MNVLLLTPDAVGGTLLHTALTVYMQLNHFDKPVLSLYDLVIGVEKYWHSDFNQTLVRTNEKYQTLDEIQSIVSSVDHYKVCKLTQYNIRRRQDSIAQQVAFYNWCNTNFFVVACLRDNIFEHALSWSFNKITQRLNVYSFEEKLETFGGMYQNGVNIDPLSLKQSLNDYRDYVGWINDNFKVASYYTYEKHLHNLEDYILALPIFSSIKKPVNWQQTFGIDFQTYNKHHFLLNNIGALSLEPFAKNTIDPCTIGNSGTAVDYEQAVQNFILDYQKVAAPSWPMIQSLNDYKNLPDTIKHECETQHQITYWLDMAQIKQNQTIGKFGTIPTAIEASNVIDTIRNAVIEPYQEFLSQTAPGYNSTNQAIERMTSLGILGKGMPIKKQTLAEKLSMVKNLQQCVDTYNDWANKHPHIAKTIDLDNISNEAKIETDFWTKQLCKLK